jgi:hypothetical protein
MNTAFVVIRNLQKLQSIVCTKSSRALLAVRSVRTSWQRLQNRPINTCPLLADALRLDCKTAFMAVVVIDFGRAIGGKSVKRSHIVFADVAAWDAVFVFP